MNKLKTSLLFSSILLGATSTAGEIEVPNKTAATTTATEKSTSDWIDFSLNGRLRYEFRDDETASDSSTAGTVRVRPGMTLLPGKAFSAYFESEHTYAFEDEYESGPGANGPTNPGNTAILDPENNELNQAYVQYKSNGILARVGRQRIILDKAALVGNVGWRQNEQTYDAALIGYTADKFNITYAFVDKVNRIFGEGAGGAAESLEGTTHLLNGSYKFDGFTLGAYAYLMDFDEVSFARASNNTYGVFTDFKIGEGMLHAEFAMQSDADSSWGSYDAEYAQVSYSQKMGGVGIKVGVDYLSEYFVTPLATVHAYNGFADKFIGNRLGLTPATTAATIGGLTDFYVGATKKVSDVTLKGIVHYFTDDAFEKDHGYELDLVAIKPLSAKAKFIGKAAYYGGGLGSDDEITQVSGQIDFKF